MKRKPLSRGAQGWAIKWREQSLLDGQREYFMGAARCQRPKPLAGYKTMVFATRREAREFIKSEYGYIATRQDLRHEPHGWKMPVAVPVVISVAEAA